MKEVAVLGAGMTLFRRHLKETGKELSFLAAKMAMEDADIKRKNIDSRIQRKNGFARG